MWMNLYLSQTRKNILRKGVMIPFSPLQLYIKAALDGGADSPPLARQRQKHWKSHQPNCLSQPQNIFPSYKKKCNICPQRKTFMCICYICVNRRERVAVQAWPVPAVLIFRARCRTLWLAAEDVVELNREQPTANSYVSSGQPPPEHWALHHTASAGTQSRASQHRILNVALEAF